MSIFDRIKSAIFGEAHAAQTPAATSAPAAAPTSATPSPTPTASAQAAPSASPSSASPTPAPQTASTTAAPAANVDVGSILDAAVKKSGQKLDWKHSIVDLMKLLDMDSSLTSRKELAAELHYPGDTSDSASMNIWLHQEVLKKFIENGGDVPSELLA